MGNCSRYDAPTADAPWLDHTVAWLRDGGPAALTSAPYGLSPMDVARLEWWPQQDPRLHVARGTGWYGFTTTQVVVWRYDILGDVEPARRDAPAFLQADV
ncbi:hypothetical protein QCN29_30170 [Streptomyces sp. HNM0663]|uniref:Uncharacterized protein n=1 Tax=Streptomyces chengmaiensis TaxID=3040919 RepID=A0ABT6HW77_9ACTN|nr:hypothetical protein [Streptomyces chengmaiensis]MDH2392969.1 hypothetical protein [Streptomyces chengmaiensis]